MSSFKTVARLFAAVCILCAPFPAAAQSIAVVDLQKIMAESAIAQNLQAQVQSYRDKFQGEVSKMEDDLRDTQKLLSSEDNGMTPEQLAAKKQEFERNLASTRDVVEKKKRALDEGFTKAMDQLRADIVKVVAAIADEKGYQLVLTRENVVLVEKDIDITAEVMKRLNESAGEIKVEVKEE